MEADLRLQSKKSYGDSCQDRAHADIVPGMRITSRAGNKRRKQVTMYRKPRSYSFRPRDSNGRDDLTREQFQARAQHSVRMPGSPTMPL